MNTRLVLTSIRKHGLKLNLSKCQFERAEVTFLGHFISDRGVEADPTKIRAINEMPLPTNKKELQRFLGVVNYLAKFIPNLSDHTAPLRSLLEKDTIWSMQDPQIEAIAKLKKLITTSPVLKFYDPNLPTKVSCDASKTGLSAVLEQKHDDDVWYPVAYGSGSLSSSEQNYCQLERETLSIVFATHKFHQYLYGSKFDVNNDHLPLKSIFNKPLAKAHARIQRFLLRLQQYDFNMHYLPGKHLKVIDALSRASFSDCDPEIPEEESDHYVYTVMGSSPISFTQLQQFQSETESDSTLKLLTDYIRNRWPNQRKEVEPNIRPFFTHRDA